MNYSLAMPASTASTAAVATRGPASDQSSGSQEKPNSGDVSARKPLPVQNLWSEADKAGQAHSQPCIVV